MPESLIKSKKKYYTLLSLCFLFTYSLIYAGETPSVPGTKVYFINIKDGQKLKSPFFPVKVLTVMSIIGSNTVLNLCAKFSTFA